MKLVASPHVPRHQSSNHVSSTLTPATKSYSYTTRQEEEKGEALEGTPEVIPAANPYHGTKNGIWQRFTTEHVWRGALLPQPCTRQGLGSTPQPAKKRWKGEFDAVEETPVKTLPRAQTLWLLLGPTQILPAQARQQPSPAWSASGRHREKHVTPGRAGEPPRSCCSLAPIHQLCPGLELQSRGHPSHAHLAQQETENLVPATGSFPPCRG